VADCTAETGSLLRQKHAAQTYVRQFYSTSECFTHYTYRKMKILFQKLFNWSSRFLNFGIVSIFLKLRLLYCCNFILFQVFYACPNSFLTSFYCSAPPSASRRWRSTNFFFFVYLIDWGLFLQPFINRNLFFHFRQCSYASPAPTGVTNIYNIRKQEVWSTATRLRCGSVVRTSVFGWQIFHVLRLIYGWHVTSSWVKCPLWVNHQPSIPSGSVNE